MFLYVIIGYKSTTRTRTMNAPFLNISINLLEGQTARFRN